MELISSIVLLWLAVLEGAHSNHCLSGTVTGHVHLDDHGDVYIDGVIEVTQTDYRNPEQFCAPTDWEVVAVFATDHAGSAEIALSVEPDTFTNTSWKCTETYEPGWHLPEFDDDNWPAAHFLRAYQPGWNPPDMDPRTDNIWTSTASTDCYCRARRTPKSELPSICDAPLPRYAPGIHFRKIDPFTAAMRLTKTSEFTFTNRIGCALACLGNGTSCNTDMTSWCLPPEGGCCGYLYDHVNKLCELYTRDIPSGSGVPSFTSPPYSNWQFYAMLK